MASPAQAYMDGMFVPSISPLQGAEYSRSLSSLAPWFFLALACHVAAVAWLFHSPDLSISAEQPSAGVNDDKQWSVIAVSSFAEPEPIVDEAVTDEVVEKPAETVEEAKPVKLEPEKTKEPEPVPLAANSETMQQQVQPAPLPEVAQAEQSREMAALQTSGSEAETLHKAFEPEWVETPNFSITPTRPAYPSLARKRNQQGSVLLEIWIDESGRQTRLLISKSSGYKLLDKAAIDAAERWRFKPHRKNGVPVQSRVRVPINFSIK